MSEREVQLLIVFVAESGGSARMAEEAERGASAEGAQVRRVHGTQAGLDDLLWADAVIIATPENFGYMAGAIKDFFDRTFYPAQGQVDQLPYAVLVRAGNDGSFAVASVERIARGYPFRKVAEPILSVGGQLDAATLTACYELGQSLVLGLSMGLFGRYAAP